MVIESVLREDETFLKFQAKSLSRLTLISLHDSDAAWNLNDLFTKKPPSLNYLYIERRFDEGEDSHLKIRITADDLLVVSKVVKSLHLRGYVPSLVLSSTPSYKRCFSQLKVFMLDISQISQSKSIKIEPFAEPGKINLSFREENFPELHTLILMCPNESKTADSFSNVHIDISLFIDSIKFLRICSLINSPRIVVNGYILNIPEKEVEQKKVHIPVVESRRCYQWRQSSIPSSWEFKYDKEIILKEYDYWLTDIREY